MPATLGILQSGGTVTEVSATNGLPVNIVGGGGSGGTAAADNAAFTEGTSTLTPVGGEFNNAPGAPTSGRVSVVRVSTGRAFMVNLRNDAGTEIGTVANPVQTTISGALGAGANTIGAVTAPGAAALALDSSLTTISGKLPAALVGGRLDVNIGASGATVPVSGTFWQATQPVSGTVTANAGSGTLAVSLASLPALPAGSNTIGAVTAPGAAALALDASLTTISGKLPAALVGGRLDVNVGAALPTGANVIGAVTQSGTWNVTVNAAIAAGANTIGAVTQASGPWTVSGAAASNATLAGNPVRVGISDVTNAQDWLQVKDQATLNAMAGIPMAALMVRNAGGDMRVVGSSALVADQNALNNSIATTAWDFNGSNFERHRSNVSVTHLSSASRSSTQGPTNVTTYNARAIMIVLDMTTVGTGSVTLKIDYIDSVSGKAINLLTGAAVVSNSTNIYKIGIGLTAAANAVDVDYLPRTIAITVTANNANPATYSVGYDLIAA